MFQYAVLSLVGPSSLFRIVSHIGRDKLVSEPRPTIGAPFIDRIVWPLLSLEENYFQSLAISESRNSFYSSAPFVALVRILDVGVLNYSSSPSNFFRIAQLVFRSLVLSSLHPVHFSSS